jgi:hypothetical protein
MAQKEKGKAIMQLKIDEKTKGILIELAGGERKVGEYLDRMAPILQAAQGKVERAEDMAYRRQLAISILEAQGNE